MTNLVRHVEELGHQPFSVPGLIRSAAEVVSGDRRIDVRGRAGNRREAIAREVSPNLSRALLVEFIDSAVVGGLNVAFGNSLGT